MSQQFRFNILIVLLIFAQSKYVLANLPELIEICAKSEGGPKKLQIEVVNTPQNSTGAVRHEARVKGLSDHFDVHFTPSEILQYIQKNFTHCDPKEDDHLQSRLKTFSFFPYSHYGNSAHSVLWVRQFERLNRLESVSGVYLKVIHPEKAKYLVPDTRNLNVKRISGSTLRDDSDHTCKKPLNLQRLPEYKDMWIYKESSPKVFSEIHLEKLEFPLFKIGEWAQLFPNYKAFVNTSWFDVSHGVPHAIPCTAIFGTTISHGEVIQEPIGQFRESLGLLAVLKSGEVKIVSPEEKEQILPQIESAFSGIVVQKNFVKKGLGFTNINTKTMMHTFFSTIRTAFALDSDGNLIVFSQTKKSTVPELVAFLKNNLSAKDILIADGGGSRSLLVKDVGESPDFEHWIYTKPTDHQGARPVPSILAISANDVVIEKSVVASKYMQKENHPVKKLN